MKYNEIIGHIIGIIRQRFLGTKPSLSMRFRADLVMGDIDMEEFAMHLKQSFGIHISAEETKKFITVNDAVVCMAKKLNVDIPQSISELCKHCGLPIAIRNPSGYCDHLKYPESCKTCQDMLKPKPSLPEPVDPTGHVVDDLYMKIILTVNGILDYLKERDK